MTWNINSVRLRLDLVERLTDSYAPDLFLLQETKVEDNVFPHRDIEDIGYEYRHIRGIKGYNGVALLSKVPLYDCLHYSRVSRDDARHISARLELFKSLIEIHNIYVPAGGYVADANLNDKFAHKLSFVDELSVWFKHRDNPSLLLLAGDFNIAPLAEDVWSHKQLLDVVSHTPIEVEALNNFQESVDFVDAVRMVLPAPQKIYSWWSYRAQDYKIGNRGRRLDHIWLSPQLSKKLITAEIVSDARSWVSPSDHVPVFIDLDIDK